MTHTPQSARPNRLASEKSPYLLQHAHNPVDWFPWGPEAFELARRENKPILLSIGYSTCHWCHVMERESFTDPAIGDFLAKHFVSVKLDREERPDVDKIYMTAAQAMSLGGGWPLNIFLTPELHPFYAGTYFPPRALQGRPSFIQVLEHIASAWDKNMGQMKSDAAGITTQLKHYITLEPDPALVLSKTLLDRAAAQFKREYDEVNGGFGGAPKFPRPSQPAFLLAHAVRSGDQEGVDMVARTCAAMRRGGIHDHLGGGFSRYAVDSKWLVPHFEKMLYDNAQLIHLFLDVHLVTGHRDPLAVATETADYVLRDMTSPEGGFYSAEDADSEGKEGKFYCWTMAEMEALLDADEALVAIRHFGVTARGNFLDHSDPDPLPGQNVLSIVDSNLSDAERLALSRAVAKLRAHRATRVRPHRDDKVLASWNGMMLGALARLAAVAGSPGHLKAALENAAFIQAHLWDAASCTLHNRWREGERDQAQLLEAYASVADGLVDLYQATLDSQWLTLSTNVADAMLSRFHDADEGGFWQSDGADPALILRIKDDYDGAEPSGNSIAAMACLKLARITGEARYESAAAGTLRLLADRLQGVPQAVPQLLRVLDCHLAEPVRVVIPTGNPELRSSQLRAVHGVFNPSRVVLGAEGPVVNAAEFRAAHPDKVQICRGVVCLEPISDPADIRQALSIHLADPVKS